MSIQSIQHDYEAKGGAVNQRFEIKYLVSDMTAEMIKDFVTTYMDPDPQGREYPVTSLYLDNAPLSMFWSSEMGERNRYKLRLRSYTDQDGFQVFAEVKRRLDKVVLKSRVAIYRERIESLLDGSGVLEELLMEPTSKKALNDLRYFRELAGAFGARPCATVRYQREAFVSRDGEPLRITFDRDLCCIPTTEYNHEIWNADSFWHTLPEVPVVLEVKFTDHYPAWVQQMIHRFGLTRGSMAKYVECVKILQSEGVAVIPEGAIL